MAKTLNSAPTAGSTYAGRSEVKSTANHKAMNDEQMQFENEKQKKSLEQMEVETFEQSGEQSESLLEMQERLRLERELEAEQETELQRDKELEVPVEGQDVQLESKQPEYDVTSKSKSLVHGNSDKEKEEVVEPDLEAIGAMDEADKDTDKKDKSLELSGEPQVEPQSTVNVTSRQVSVTDYSKYNQAIEEQYFAGQDYNESLGKAASTVFAEMECDAMKKDNEVVVESTTQTVNVKPDDSQQGKEVEGNQATTETAGQIEAENKEAETHDQPQAQRQSEKMSVESEVKTAQPKNTMSREEMMAKYAYVGENYEKQNASYERAQNADYPARMPSLDGPRMKMH